MNHDKQSKHDNMTEHNHQHHHAMMVADFRRRFWISLAITIPVLILSPLIQDFLGIANTVSFPGDAYILWDCLPLYFSMAVIHF
jgi:Cu2+-exporting ATPase